MGITIARFSRVRAWFVPSPCRHLQDDIKMMWEPNVVAAQVEPYVTDYGIDTVSNTEGTTAHSLSVRIHFPRIYDPSESLN